MVSIITTRQTLQWTLRSQLGNGPMALLPLRSLTLPDQIFSVDASVGENALFGNGNNLSMESAQ
ncbi:hypothetical protein C9426_16165 [Serratia sp. S1B]|nr:hypothetical protein C9426_16165 [Serratia sp. S1B]